MAKDEKYHYYNELRLLVLTVEPLTLSVVRFLLFIVQCPKIIFSLAKMSYVAYHINTIISYFAGSNSVAFNGPDIFLLRQYSITCFRFSIT